MHFEHLGEKEIYKEFGIDKGAMLTMEKSKRDTTERIKLSHQECIGTLGEKEIYKGLGIEKGAMLRMKKVKEIQRKEYNCPKKECIGTLGEKEIYKHPWEYYK